MRVVFLFVLCVTSALEAAAITGGSVTMTGGAMVATGSFALRGDGFEVTGLAADGFSNALLCQGLCADDATLGTSAGLGELRNGTAVLGGVPQAVTWFGDLRIDGQRIVLAGPGDYTAPFTMTGYLCAYQGPMAPCAFELRLTGQGAVYLTETRSPTGGGLVGRTVTYVFTPEAIPEASTGSLLALGGAALAWRARRGRR